MTRSTATKWSEPDEDASGQRPHSQRASESTTQSRDVPSRWRLGLGGHLRVTPQTRAVLRTILVRSCFGYEIMHETGIPSGTVYPILARLEAAGWIESWNEDARERWLPPRRCYRLTQLGREQLPHEE